MATEKLDPRAELAKMEAEETVAKAVKSRDLVEINDKLLSGRSAEVSKRVSSTQL